jgi:hypothetical protein
LVSQKALHFPFVADYATVLSLTDSFLSRELFSRTGGLGSFYYFSGGTHKTLGLLDLNTAEFKLANSFGRCLSCSSAVLKMTLAFMMLTLPFEGISGGEERTIK